MKPVAVARPTRVLMALVLVVGSLPFVPARAAAAVCGDVQVIWARGSGQQPGDPLGLGTFVDVNLAARVGPEVAVTAYELGTGAGYRTYRRCCARSSKVIVSLVSIRSRVTKSLAAYGVTLSLADDRIEVFNRIEVFD